MMRLQAVRNEAVRPTCQIYYCSLKGKNINISFPSIDSILLQLKGLPQYDPSLGGVRRESCYFSHTILVDC